MGSGTRWAGHGSRDHEYVESITMYRADDSAGDDTDDDLDYKDDVDMQISVRFSLTNIKSISVFVRPQFTLLFVVS